MSVKEQLRSLLTAIDEAGGEVMIVGAMAMDALGVARATYDVDLQVRLPEPPDEWASTLFEFQVRERSRDPVFGQETLVLQKTVDPVPFELFLVSHWFTDQALDRRQSIQSRHLGGAVEVPAPEDFLLLKACYWTHPSRSRRKAAQDGVDIEIVAETHLETLDVDYVRKMGERLGVWGPLSEVLDDLG